VKPRTFLEDLGILRVFQRKERDSSGLLISIMTAQECPLAKSFQGERALNDNKEVLEVTRSYNMVRTG